MNSNNSSTNDIEEKFNWEDISTKIAQSFNFSSDEVNRLCNSKTAKYIAAIPYAANCYEAERTAMAHVAVYIIANKSCRKIFDHNEKDNEELFNRLHLISTFKGGDKDIINKGMNLLALQMISGYFCDKEKDTLSGEYNPLNDEKWNYEILKEDLVKKTDCIENTLLDSIMSSQDALESKWSI